MDPTRFKRNIEESSELFASVEKSVEDGLAVDRNGYVAYFFKRRATVEGSSVAQGVLAALIINIIWSVLYEFALSASSELLPADSVATIRLMLLACSALVLVFSIVLVISILRDNRKAKTRLQIEELVLRRVGAID